MKRLVAALCLVVMSTLNVLPAAAQNTYTGSRVAVFDVKVLEVKNRSLLFKCRIANTGREISSTGKSTVVEIDTVNLPTLMWGLEPQIAEAARMRMPRLRPGEISEQLWLEADLPARVEPPASANVNCLEMVLDTAYLLNFGRDEMTVGYVLRNNGSRVVDLTGPETVTLVNVYFVSGAKLTRGAIPAGSYPVQAGMDCLTCQLQPGQKMAGVVTFKLTSRTKFSPNVLLELVPPRGMTVCSLGRNISVIKLD